NEMWRIRPPVFSYSQYQLQRTEGKWHRCGDEISIGDSAGRRVFFSLNQANRMSGRAAHLRDNRHEHHTDWKRIPKPLPATGIPNLWYGLARHRNGEAIATVLSGQKSFTFRMPTLATGTFRQSPGATFVLLTGFIDRGDLMSR